MVNVRDAQFGAKGDGSVDDSVAIQKAVDYASSLSANPFAKYSATIYIPAGYYLISNPINLTNKNGIWVVGDGGSYFNTIILGNTGSRAMFDFSGSSHAGCENLTFLPSSSTNPSTLGVQFALTSTGGLNCGIRKCFMQMTDVPTANAGFGSIGLLNVRSEEFFIHECRFIASTPLVMGLSVDFSPSGISYTASSAFQTLTLGTGSMGVTSINGTSLQSIEKRRPAMVLYGTNSLSFQGYLGQIVANTGTNETAILCVSYTTNLKVHATVESFSRVLQIRDTGFGSSEIDVVSANSTSPTTELFDVTGCTIVNVKVRVSLPVVSERPNRYVIYHSPIAGGNQPATGFMSNCEIECYDIPSNQYIMTQNLLKKSTNVTLNTVSPFEKRGGRIRQLYNNVSGGGANNSVSPINVLRFLQAIQLPINNTNGGYYRIWIDGVVRAGSYYSGAAATLAFQAQIVINQRFNGVFDAPGITIITLDESISNPSYLTLTGVLVDINFANGIGVVSVTPRLTGSATGEPVYFDGLVELQSDYLVNEALPI